MVKIIEQEQHSLFLQYNTLFSSSNTAISNPCPTCSPAKGFVWPSKLFIIVNVQRNVFILINLKLDMLMQWFL